MCQNVTMNMRSTLGRHLLVLTALAALVAAAVASSAAAATPKSNCPARTLKQAFSRWGDTHQYFFAPNGGFENGLSGWTTGNNPTVVSGNESYYLNSSSDKSSLNLPAGAWVKTGQICTNPQDQTVRLMVKGATGQLKFDAYILCNGNIRTWSGQVDSNGASGWRPSPVIQFALSGQCGTTATIQLTFTALGSTWQIDDLYIDPFKDK
jgi:hypothetical protein